MTSVRIEMNGAGIRKLLADAGVQRDLERRGERIAAAAGDGFDAVPDPGRKRARVVVLTQTAEAMEAEATRRALTRAVDAGRG